MGPDGAAGGQAQRFDDKSVLRHGHRHVQLVAIQAQWIQVVGLQKLGQQPFDFRHQLRKALRRHQRDTQLQRQRLRHIGVRHQSQAHQHAPNHAAHFLLGRQRPVQVARAEFSGLHQHLAQARARRGGAVQWLSQRLDQGGKSVCGHEGQWIRSRLSRGGRECSRGTPPPWPDRAAPAWAGACTAGAVMAYNYDLYSCKRLLHKG